MNSVNYDDSRYLVREELARIQSNLKGGYHVVSPLGDTVYCHYIEPCILENHSLTGLWDAEKSSAMLRLAEECRLFNHNRSMAISRFASLEMTRRRDTQLVEILTDDLNQIRLDIIANCSRLMSRIKPAERRDGCESRGRPLDE